LDWEEVRTFATEMEEAEARGRADWELWKNAMGEAGTWELVDPP